MDIQFLRLNDKWALAYDPLQWILQKRGGLRKIGSQAGQEIWRGKSFIANKKGVLLRVLREKGIEPTPEAQKALDALPDTFREFCVAITERPNVAPGELFQGAPSVRGGTVQRDEAA